MKTAIVYSSKTGNTKGLAEKVKALLPKEDMIYFGEPDDMARKADLLFVGFWTDKGSAGGEILQFLQTLEGKKVFLFGTAGYGRSGDYFQRILSGVSKSLPEGNEVIGSFMCQGKMPLTIRNRYQEMLKKDPSNGTYLDFILNFDEASHHPDEEDERRLEEAALYIIKEVYYNETKK